mgnify:CR=1 FL=1
MKIRLWTMVLIVCLLLPTVQGCGRDNEQAVTANIDACSLLTQDEVDREEKIRLLSWGVHNVHSWPFVHSVHPVHKPRSSKDSLQTGPLDGLLPCFAAFRTLLSRVLRIMCSM